MPRSRITSGGMPCPPSNEVKLTSQPGARQRIDEAAPRSENGRIGIARAVTLEDVHALARGHAGQPLVRREQRPREDDETGERTLRAERDVEREHRALREAAEHDAIARRARLALRARRASRSTLSRASASPPGTSSTSSSSVPRVIARWKRPTSICHHARASPKRVMHRGVPRGARAPRGRRTSSRPERRSLRPATTRSSPGRPVAVHQHDRERPCPAFFDVVPAVFTIRRTRSGPRVDEVHRATIPHPPMSAIARQWWIDASIYRKSLDFGCCATERRP